MKRLCNRNFTLYIPAVSAFQENILLVFSEPIEVKVDLLFENVLTGCTVTGSKCSRIIQYWKVIQHDGGQF